MDRARVAARLRDAYGFGDVAIGDRLEGGYANDLFRIEADGRRLVLRIKHPPVDQDDITWEHRLTRSLAERLSEVPAPLPARDGGTFVALGDRVAWLVPFVDAAPADAARAAHRVAAARALGRLHAVDAGVPPRPRLEPLRDLTWPPLRVPPELHEWGHTIAREREWAIDYVGGLARDRPLCTGLTHGDYFPGNVLIAGDEVAAIVDWEEARSDWLSWDLANAAGSFCTFGDELDRDACERFAAAYRADGGPAPAADDDLLIPLMRVRWILEVLRAPTDRHPRWEHQRGKLRALANLAR
jgi:Ser/Thr protein kinase RdoA (MazF antagonist)